MACYGVDDPIYAVVQLAQAVMRSEMGKMTLDRTFSERAELNKRLVDAMNERSLRTDWGMEILRYEIKDITPPGGVIKAMQMQAEAERKKRVKVLNSEGEKQAIINTAHGKKTATVLISEAAKVDQINRAKGEADAIFARAQAMAKGLSEVSRAIMETGGSEATSLKIAEHMLRHLTKSTRRPMLCCFLITMDRVVLQLLA